MRIVHHFNDKHRDSTSYATLHRKWLPLLLSRPACTAVRSVHIAVRQAG